MDAMVSSLGLARSFALATISLLAVACSAAPDQAPSEVDDAVDVRLDRGAVEERLFNTGGSGSTSGTSTCTVVTCPDNDYDCFKGCKGAGGRTSSCASACGCTTSACPTTPTKIY
jgi:hypothetical protein